MMDCCAYSPLRYEDFETHGTIKLNECSYLERGEHVNDPAARRYNHGPLMTPVMKRSKTRANSMYEQFPGAFDSI